jgi:hypothetical protein
VFGRFRDGVRRAADLFSGQHSPRAASGDRHYERRGGVQLREELLLRIAELGDVQLNTPKRLQALYDVVGAFEPAGFEFRPNYNECVVSSGGGGQVSIVGELWAANRRAASLDRTLFVGDRKVWHNYFRTHGEFRGTGLAPLVLRQSFAFFDRLGIRRAVVHAGLETGVYYWARCGFDFLVEDERQDVRNWFTGVLRALGHPMDISHLHTAYELATVGKVTDEKTSMKVIAEQLRRGAVSPSVRRLFQEAARANNIRYDQDIDLGRAIFLAYPKLWWGYLDLLFTAGAQRAIFEAHAQSRIAP